MGLDVLQVWKNELIQWNASGGLPGIVVPYDTVWTPDIAVQNRQVHSSCADIVIFMI